MKMYRLTLDKDVKDMGHIELLHNMTFGQDGEIWYHDFTNEISLRNFIRELGEKFNIEIPKDDCSFDDEMFYRLAEADSGTIEGILALLNFVFIGYDGLRARLKYYEDLEEQGRLIELPCEKVYRIINYDSPKYAFIGSISIEMMPIYDLKHIDNGNIFFSTKEKAEAKLKEMEGAE